MADSQFSRFLELKNQTERQHTEFLKTEVQTGLTLLGVARTELASGDLPHMERALAGARAAFNILLARLPGLHAAMTTAERHWFQEKMKVFGDALEHFPG
ncbi:MAG: hypothetical protein M3Z85_02250 [Acidobacteriota bacterium]|nr:hypothetical protein [Acidobacteriota bacterium]